VELRIFEDEDGAWAESGLEEWTPAVEGVPARDGVLRAMTVLFYKIIKTG
jgi:hypothetical protein